MEPSIEIYQPSRWYSWAGWAASGGCLVGLACGFRAPLAFIPGSLCALTAVFLFWLAARPRIKVGDTQFNIGERAIAWREVREINTWRFNKIHLASPLILKIKLTNSRRRLLVFPGDADRIDQLAYQLRKNSHLATFDGVSHRDYWGWSDLTNSSDEKRAPEPPPVRMLIPEDEEEIERMYQKLKTVGHLDSRSDSSKTPHEG